MMQSQEPNHVNCGVIIDDGPGDGQAYTLTGLRWHVDISCSSSDFMSKWNDKATMSTYNWEVTWAIIKLQKNQTLESVIVEWPKGEDIYDPDTNMICWGTTTMRADFDGKAAPIDCYKEWDDHTKSMRIMGSGERIAIIWRFKRHTLLNVCYPEQEDVKNYDLVFNTKCVLQSFRMSTR